ncbi:MAG: hypothetical protein K2I90_12960, partial [Odoribacter sp.]|nr:hypothetical protein [Odoribacter sp.]
MKRNILYRAVCVYISMLLGLTACMDDEIRPWSDVPEGETVINAVVDFNTLTPALATRAVAGDAIKKINTLWVLAYDQNGELAHKFTGDELQNYKETMVRTDTLPKSAESGTPRATFSLKIPYGIYRMDAVATVNLADALYQEAIQT